MRGGCLRWFGAGRSPAHSRPPPPPPRPATPHPVAAQVLLRYNMQRGVPVIPKASSQPHLQENFDHAFDWRLSNADKVALDALDAGKRYIRVAWRSEADWGDVEEGGVLKPSLVLKGQAAAGAGAAK
jgi:hypothetical protein